MLGWKPDSSDERDWSYGAPPTEQGIPRTASLSNRITSLRDQTGTNGCVGCSIAYGFMACGELVQPSAMFLYYEGRAKRGEQALDEGTFYRDVLEAFAKMGAPPEKDWPFDPSKVNAMPPWSAYRSAHPYRERIAYYRIDSPPGTRARAARHAIFSGNPVLIGTQVAVAFTMDRRGGYWEPPTSEQEIAGGHAMCLTEYNPKGFAGPQSWGPQAHGSGWFELADGYLEWKETRDLWVVTQRRSL
jgi:hypothetical protein